MGNSAISSNRTKKIGRWLLARLCTGPTLLLLSVSWAIMQFAILPAAYRQMCRHFGDLCFEGSWLREFHYFHAIPTSGSGHGITMYISTELSAGIVTDCLLFGFLFCLIYVLRSRLKSNTLRIVTLLTVPATGALISILYRFCVSQAFINFPEVNTDLTLLVYLLLGLKLTIIGLSLGITMVLAYRLMKATQIFQHDVNIY